MTDDPGDENGLWGHYAGCVSRFVAYVVDTGTSTAIFMLVLATASFAASILVGHPIHWSRGEIWVAIAFVAWQFVYYAYSWAANGKTFGMALLGVQVVSRDGAQAGPRRAVVRTLAFPLSFLLCGLGFAGHPVRPRTPGAARRDRGHRRRLHLARPSAAPALPGPLRHGSRPGPRRWPFPLPSPGPGPRGNDRARPTEPARTRRRRTRPAANGPLRLSAARRPASAPPPQRFIRNEPLFHPADACPPLAVITFQGASDSVEVPRRHGGCRVASVGELVRAP